MLLDRYWQVLCRYRWLILALGGLTIVLGAISVAFAPPKFDVVTRVSFTPKISPSDPTKYFDYDRYYTWLSAEYMVDDYGEIVKSEGFAQKVSLLLGGQPDYRRLLGAFTTKKTHRILRVTVSWDSEAEGMRIAKAVDDALVQTADQYLRDDMKTAGAVITVVDPPISKGRVGKLIAYGLVALRGLIGFVLGIGIALLLNYLDHRVRRADEIEALGLPLLGAVPRLKPEVFRVHYRKAVGRSVARPVAS